MSKNFAKSVFLLFSSFLLFASSVYGGTHYVDIKGNNLTGDGSSGKPLKTVEHALNLSKYGDTISIRDGVYSEGQLVVPAGVSITSTSKDNKKVKLQPNKALGGTTAFILLSTVTPGSSGDQAISYIDINGKNGANTGEKAIKLQNRNNVRIYNCNIHDFTGTGKDDYSIEIKSTEPKDAKGGDWWSYWPADPQEPGNDKNINSLWPSGPVEGFEFYNNSVINTEGFRPYNLKNSSIHDNYFDNRLTFGWCLVATPAFLDHVKIYNNNFYAKRQEDPKAQFTVELWLHRNNCEYYNNVVEGFFSVTCGKETKVYNNTLTMPSTKKGIGIEFNMQSYGEIKNNYIKNVGTHGISVGIGSESGGKDYIMKNVTIENNEIYNSKYQGIVVKSEGGKQIANTIKTQNINIYKNIIQSNDGMGSNGIYIYTIDNLGTGVINNVNVKNNVISNMIRPGVNEGSITNLTIESNQFNNNTYNYWNGGTSSTSTTSTTSNPPSPSNLRLN